MGNNPNVVKEGVVQKEYVINIQNPKSMNTANSNELYTQVIEL